MVNLQESLCLKLVKVVIQWRMKDLLVWLWPRLVHQSLFCLRGGAQVGPSILIG
ncbi:transcriptional regulator/ araC family domain protein [Synechococcus sp. ROS8604]|nr:transcriptional regulator/ araC family domain protein [Synechococcus sp. ROS8604]